MIKGLVIQHTEEKIKRFGRLLIISFSVQESAVKLAYSGSMSFILPDEKRLLFPKKPYRFHENGVTQNTSWTWGDPME